MDESANMQRTGGDLASVPSMVEKLISVLEGHLANHRRLLKAMERKKTACVNADINALDEIVESEKVAIEAIGGTETERLAVTTELGQALGLPAPKRLRLVELINLVGEDHRDTLLDLRDEIRDVADDIDRLNRLNREIVLHSLEHVHLFLSMLRGADPDAKIYKKGGAEDGKLDPILLDRKI